MGLVSLNTPSRVTFQTIALAAFSGDLTRASTRVVVFRQCIARTMMSKMLHPQTAQARRAPLPPVSRSPEIRQRPMQVYFVGIHHRMQMLPYLFKISLYVEIKANVGTPIRTDDFEEDLRVFQLGFEIVAVRDALKTSVGTHTRTVRSPIIQLRRRTCVCFDTVCVCEREREREKACACVRERERERKRVCVCVCV